MMTKFIDAPKTVREISDLSGEMLIQLKGLWIAKLIVMNKIMALRVEASNLIQTELILAKMVAESQVSWLEREEKYRIKKSLSPYLLASKREEGSI